MANKLDVIIFGATGFTGKWTVFEACKVLKGLKWGVAGRSRGKIESVLQEMSTKTQTDLSKTPISIADVDNDASLEEMTSKCRLLVNCCGPYRFYGEPVVRACLKTGTHHLDVSGESQFMELMQLKYHKEAEEKGIYVISACGFDSIPSEMGLVYLEKNFEGVVNSVETYLKTFMLKKLKYSGAKAHTGTWESAVHAFGSLHEVKAIRAQLYSQKLPKFEPKLNVRPLISSMDGVNGFLIPFPGPDLSVMMRSQRFFYEKENKRPIQVMSYLNFKTRMEAICIIMFGAFFGLMAKFGFGRKLLLKYPKIFSFGFFSHEGPSDEYMQNIGFALYLKGQGWPTNERLLESTDKFSTPPNSSITVKVTGVNPGYGATCVALLSSAKTVLTESDKMPGSGGVLPPAAAFSKTNIIEELERHENGLKFEKMQAIKSRFSFRQLCSSGHKLNSNVCSKAPLIQNDNRRIVIEPLKRDLISVRGPDAKDFLQGLITNDMQHLDGRGAFGSIYTLFLNRNGRILYDTIIYRAPEKDSYLIECDRQICNELRRYLRQFRVRRKVDIESERDFDLWVAFSPQNSGIITDIDRETAVSLDPRLPWLGARIFTQVGESIQCLSERFTKARKGIVVTPDANLNYNSHRFQYGVGEGVKELPPAKCFPLEANADYMNGLSFQKGCYVGQELTARTFHTGVVRKRLMPLRLSKSAIEGTEDVTTEAGYKVGVLRGVAGSYALALLHVEKVLNVPFLMINGYPCHANKPNWWPEIKNDPRKSPIEKVSAKVFV